MKTPTPTKRRAVWHATPKQKEAFAILRDNTTNELVYGGAAGGAKSYLGCAWCVLNAFEYPGSRGLLGRAVLKQLKQSTLLTLFEVCKNMGLVRGTDYHFNAHEGVITFIQNGSTIYLKDLAYYPSDPDYDSLGSTEYTYAFIDEASQIRVKAKNVVRSRIRYKLDEYGIIPKILLTCNPSKNFLYTEFYKPWKIGELPSNRGFVWAKVQDNPFLPASYVESLKTLDKVSQERLLYGNWEYDDDPATLMNFDALTDLFSNELEEMQFGKDARGIAVVDTRPRYISCDVARFGADKTVISVWYGWECVSIMTYARTSTTTVAGLLKEAMAKHTVQSSHVIIDEDGIGGGVKDQMYGVKGFVANTTPFNKENYRNLKAQCWYALAAKVNSRGIRLRVENPEIRQMIIEELEQIKAKDIDKDGKQNVLPKDEIKAKIGRSPDLGDTMMMRMYFSYKPQPRLTFL